MTVTSIDTIKADAVRAAHAGVPVHQACRWPNHEPQAIIFREAYEAAANSYERQVARYGAAIGVPT